MRTIWLFLHLLGFAMWMGGGFASMVIGIASRSEARTALGALVRAQAGIQRKIIAPGVVAVVLSGFVLTMQLMTATTVNLSGWLMVMQGAGLLGAIISLVMALPAAAQVSRLEPDGPDTARYDALRGRLRLAGSIAGVLGLVALAAGVAYRMGF